jgi:hypothetical protein
MKSLTKITCVLAAGAMAVGSLFAAPQDLVTREALCQAQDWNYQTEASNLLKQVRSTAIALTREASVLDSFALNGISRETHATQVTRVKNHINEIGTQLKRLQAIRHVAAPWQQEAIDAIVPAVMKTAAHTEAAIQHLNDRKPPWDPNYLDHLQAIHDRSDGVRNIVGLHLEMAETADKLDRLQDRANTLGS